jgi:hypothetical protein
VASLGGAAVVLGVFLISVDTFADDWSRWFEALLFAAVVAIGYVLLGVLPESLRPAGIGMVLAGVPVALGWAFLPTADSFGEVRVFLLATLGAMIVCWLVPRTRARPVFVAVALIVLWLWLLGEVAGNDAFSVAPVPSPPPNTLFSLAAFQDQTVTLDELDASDPLYPLAEDCANGDLGACDDLYEQAPFGSDFHDFASECGGNGFSGGGFGSCDVFNSQPPSTFDFNSPTFQFPDDNGTTISPSITGRTGDDDLEMGLVSTLLGLAFLAALFRLDRRDGFGLATAFVVPAALALFTGAQLLGSAADEVWLAGLSIFAAGIVFGVVGHVGERRFTAWFGGFMAVVGALVIAADISDATTSDNSESLQLITPGFIVIGFGVALVAVAYLLTQFLEGRSQPPLVAAGGPPVAPPDPAPAPTPEPVSAWPPDPRANDPSPWAPPPET